MKILVFGGNGKMGAAVAYDAVRDDASSAWAWSADALPRSSRPRRG